MVIFILIFICLFVIIIYIDKNNRKEIQELESMIEYYKWHDGIYDLPKRSSRYLVQVENKEKPLRVLNYDVEQQRWIGDDYVIAWCHLPIYLFHK